MRKFLTSAAIVFTLSATAYAQDFQRGLTAFNAGDFVTALQEWRPLAEQGNAGAQYGLGYMYYIGQGIPEDHKEAMKWFHKAAEQGHAHAQANLGIMYTIGRGVPEDHKEAMKWYLKAAEQGYANSQNSLGAMYENGNGVLHDNVLAHMWYNIGSANGNELGSQNRDNLAKRMTPEQIVKAQAMARECMSSNYQNCGQ